MVTAVYPGTFDPVTMGHMDVCTRAASSFDKLVVAVYAEPVKEVTFTTEERVDMWQRSVRKLQNVEVTAFSGLVVKLAHSIGANVIVRGLRSGSDFEFEFEMAFMNKKLAPDIDTFCLMTSLPYQYISSSLLKEVTRLGGDIGNLVPSAVATALKNLRPQK